MAKKVPFAAVVAASLVASLGGKIASAADPPPARPDLAAASGELVPPVVGGLTAEQAGKRAAEASFSAAASEHLYEAAQARSDQTLAAFFPRLQGLAKYTHLSNFTPETIYTPPPGQFLVGTPSAPGTPNPPLIVSAAFPDITIPVITEQYVAEATLIIPVSDYVLRIVQAHDAALRAEDAARLDLTASRSKALADAKIAFFMWLRARAGSAVAEQTLAVARAHLHDAETQVTVGNLSKAEGLRAKTQVAAAELAVERTKSAVILSERQLRLAIHAKPEEKLDAGEGLDKALPPISGASSSFITEALATRAELKSIRNNADAGDSQASAVRNGRFPQLSAFGDALYANPNPRRFPPADEWFPTWAIGAQLTWAPNDLFSAGAAGAAEQGKADALREQINIVHDAIELETLQAFQSVVESDFAIASTGRQLDAALETYRITRDLYATGRVNGTSLTDAEVALAQARFESVDARVQARTARVRLDHATGRDQKGL